MSSWCEQCQHLYDDVTLDGCPVCTGVVVPDGPDTYRRPTPEETREHEHCDRAVDLLMGRDGDRLLATGTRSMWLMLLKCERAAARAEALDEVQRWQARVSRIEARLNLVREIIDGREDGAAPAAASVTFDADAAHRELTEAARAFADAYGSPIYPAVQGPLEQRLRAALELRKS